MERLTYDFCIGGNHCWQVKGADNLECREVCRQQEENGCKDCPIAKAFDRLAAIEDILGDDYDLDRLTPCTFCQFNPPSSSDGKPCCMCPAEAALRREQDEQIKP